MPESQDHTGEWLWWIGRDEEHMTSGPEVSREAAVRIAREEYEGAHICEARKNPVFLSDYFEADLWIERSEETASEQHMGEHYDTPLFDITDDDTKDLEKRVRAAIDQWQIDRRLVFEPYIFSETRNEEWIDGPEE